jgi:hypothetical protein
MPNAVVRAIVFVKVFASMSFSEAAFWICLTVMGAGLYFVYEWSGQRRVYTAVVTMIIATGVLGGIVYKDHERRLSPSPIAGAPALAQPPTPIPAGLLVPAASARNLAPLKGNPKPAGKLYIAIAPNGVANGALNFGTEIVNPEPKERTWTITDEICKTILTPIRTTGSEIEISVGALISDPDGAGIASQLERCLSSAPGWRVSQAVLPHAPNGVNVTASDENQAIAATLRDGLSAAGFDVHMESSPQDPGIDITIGKNAFK